MAWVNTGSNGWHADWWRKSYTEFEIFWEDGLGNRWMNTDNGDELVLVSDGGWRMAKNGHSYDSRFRAFRLHAASGVVREISDLLWPIMDGRFDSSQEGSGRYSTVQKRCESHIDKIFNANKITELGEEI